MNKIMHFLRVLFLLCVWFFRFPIKRMMAARLRDHRDVSKAMQEFCTANSRAWCVGTMPKAEGKGKILIEGLNAHTAYLMVNLVVGAGLMRKYGLPGVGLLHFPSPEIEAMFASYGINEFYYLSNPYESYLKCVKIGFEAFWILLKHPDIEELLKYNHNGVYIGKSTYDWYLRAHGEGTIESYSILFFSMLCTALLYRVQVDSLLTQEDIPFLVQAERQFVPEGVLFQHAVSKGVEVITRGGVPTSITLRRFNDPEQFFINTFRYEKKLFEYVWNNYREIGEAQGGTFIANRFSGNISKDDIIDAALAYAEENTIDRDSLCEKFGWASCKPIVIIMANTMTDGVFSNRWSLFKDNFTWLEETLRQAVANDEVNWLVKSHPSDVRNHVRITGRDIYERHAKNVQHVQFYPNELGNRSLPNLVDVVLTAHGTAGTEYSALGIPCLLAGESYYSGFGFTHEPQTQEEYFAAIADIQNMQPLTEEQIARAKVFVYMDMLLARVPISVLPGVSMYADYDKDQHLRDAVALLQKHDPLKEKLNKMICIQEEKGYRHMLNYDWIGLDESADIFENEMVSEEIDSGV